MTTPIVEINHISKLYQIGALKEPYLSLRDEIMKWLPSKKRKARNAQRKFWALDDVSFNIMEGDTVGIIGRNGAGKSTLLKVLSQITPPTKGTITMRGRVASLLEVGTGFHPELTGRENIFLNGAILGMRHEEIKRKFDEIIAFAEVEKFLDTPVKRYSSGMYVRLAFAVAAHLEPEILIVDEVLAVGDAEFQKKCLGKMNEVAKGGRTVLFVSHNMAAVTQLCARGIVIANGKVDFCGSSNDAIQHYIRKDINEQSTINLLSTEAVIADNLPAKLLSVKLTNNDKVTSNTFFIGDKMTLNITCYFNKQYKSVQLSFMVKSLTKGNIYHCVSKDAGFAPQDISGVVTFTATFPSLKLYPGSYLIDELWLATPENETLDYVRDVLSFQITPGGNYMLRNLPVHAAVVHEVPEWNTLL